MKMKLFLTALLLLTIAVPIIVVANINEAINYLNTQSPDAWNTQALAAAGEVPASLSHLESVSGTLATDYAKTILALSSVNENSENFGNLDYVEKLKSYYSNNQFGDDENLLNDDIWSILALCSIGLHDSEEVIGAKQTIIDNQNDDGGWGYSISGDSDTNDTASAIVALLESGLGTDSGVIIDAIEYLKSTQNDDGGFGWATGSDSDSGSDAWVIIALNKLGIDPDSWTSGGKSPKDHLLSLQDSDGGFWWVQPDDAEFNNKAMSAFAVIALSGKSFPIGYFNSSNQPEGGYKIRIEGSEGNVCTTNATGLSALDVVKNAAIICLFTYNIDDTAYGPYLNKINQDEASGMNGWMYFVNNISPLVGMSDYLMQDGDEILLYFGEWGAKPLHISTNKESYSSGEDVVISAMHYENDQWNDTEAAHIKGLDNSVETNFTGQASLQLTDGFYTIWLEKAGHVRSEDISFTVGSGIENNVELSVEIESGGVDVKGESIVFSVSPDFLNFGTMKIGESKSKILNMKNEGTVNLEIEANVSGDQVFRDSLELGGSDWKSFQDSIQAGTNRDLDVGFRVESGYIGSGVKKGELIIWASP